MIMKRMNNSLKKNSLAFACAIFALTVGVCFSCCKTTDKEPANVEKSKESVRPSEKNSAVGDYYASMLEKKRLRFTDLGFDAKQLPKWIYSLDEDKYLYAVGVSNAVTTKKRAKIRSEEDVMETLYDAAKFFQGDNSKPSVNGYEPLKYYTGDFVNDKTGKTMYVTAVLVRIPKNKILGK